MEAAAAATKTESFSLRGHKNKALARSGREEAPAFKRNSSGLPPSEKEKEVFSNGLKGSTCNRRFIDAAAERRKEYVLTAATNHAVFYARRRDAKWWSRMKSIVLYLLLLML